MNKHLLSAGMKMVEKFKQLAGTGDKMEKVLLVLREENTRKLLFEEVYSTLTEEEKKAVVLQFIDETILKSLKNIVDEIKSRK